VCIYIYFKIPILVTGFNRLLSRYYKVMFASFGMHSIAIVVGPHTDLVSYTKKSGVWAK
jgi:hypothetical protein